MAVKKLKIPKGHHRNKGDYAINNRFQERQRQASLKRRNPLGLAFSRKKTDSPYTPLPFMGIEQMHPINLSDYRGLASLVSDALRPGDSLRPAVAGLMINMLLTSPDNIFSKKREYRFQERNYIREQLNVFSQSMNALELFLGNESDGSLGSFKNKQRHHFMGMASLLTSDFWSAPDCFDIAYLRMSGESFFDRISSDYVVGEVFKEIHERDIEEIRQFYNGHKSELAYLEIVLNGHFEQTVSEFEINEIESNPSLYSGKLAEVYSQYLEGTSGLNDIEKEFLRKTIACLRILSGIEEEAEEIKAGIPDEDGVILNVSQRLKPKGVLFIESDRLRNIPGLAYVQTHEKVNMYQRREA
ncbi:MAG: hypothetical protein V1740_01580 [Candidatus Woesearchaeota archaeon]